MTTTIIIMIAAATATVAAVPISLYGIFHFFGVYLPKRRARKLLRKIHKEAQRTILVAAQSVKDTDTAAFFLSRGGDSTKPEIEKALIILRNTEDDLKIKGLVKAEKTA